MGDKLLITFRSRESFCPLRYAGLSSIAWVAPTCPRKDRFGVVRLCSSRPFVINPPLDFASAHQNLPLIARMTSRRRTRASKALGCEACAGQSSSLLSTFGATLSLFIGGAPIISLRIVILRIKVSRTRYDSRRGDRQISSCLAISIDGSPFSFPPPEEGGASAREDGAHHSERGSPLGPSRHDIKSPSGSAQTKLKQGGANVKAVCRDCL
jgi:hypothetical protein